MSKGNSIMNYCKTCGKRISDINLKLYNWEYSYCSLKCWENSEEVQEAVKMFNEENCPNGLNYKIGCFEKFGINEELLAAMLRIIKEGLSEDKCLLHKEGE